MDIWNNYIAMMLRADLKNSCCAPFFISPSSNAELQAENPSDVVFMTTNTKNDQVGNHSERELCSSSFSDRQVNQSGRWVRNDLPSLYYSVGSFLLFKNCSTICFGYHRNIHQSCSNRTTLISIALMKENVYIDVSMIQRRK
jgi:hypothetical protein